MGNRCLSNSIIGENAFPAFGTSLLPTSLPVCTLIMRRSVVYQFPSGVSWALHVGNQIAQGDLLADLAFAVQ